MFVDISSSIQSSINRSDNFSSIAVSGCNQIDKMNRNYIYYYPFMCIRTKSLLSVFCSHEFYNYNQFFAFVHLFQSFHRFMFSWHCIEYIIIVTVIHSFKSSAPRTWSSVIASVPLTRLKTDPIALELFEVDSVLVTTRLKSTTIRRAAFNFVSNIDVIEPTVDLISCLNAPTSQRSVRRL